MCVRARSSKYVCECFLKCLSKCEAETKQRTSAVFFLCIKAFLEGNKWQQLTLIIILLIIIWRSKKKVLEKSAFLLLYHCD